MNNKRSAFVSLAVALASLALVLSATPITATGHTAQAQEPSPSQAQSITGKIMTVEKSSFTLSIGTAISNQGTGQETSERTMKFNVDRNTTIDGKLQVGKTADVTYRESGSGSYVAISVRVAP